MVDFPELKRHQVGFVTSSIDDEAYGVAQKIIEDVRENGEGSVRAYGRQFDQLAEDAPLIIPPEVLQKKLAELSAETRSLLQRVANRIRQFAVAQRATFSDFEMAIPGGKVGHRWIPLQVAGCYAPGGRYPLPSSVLMTAITARVAGVASVWVASPNPTVETLASAALSDADGVLAVGGAQAVAALAFGMDGMLPACDVIVGPGNRYVTAAKALVSRHTRIDMLAGPSELVVVAAADADPRLVAADLLAQAEHDPDARPVLVTDERKFVKSVIEALDAQLSELPTAAEARQALASGGYVVVESLEQAIDCCRQIAPEHLSLQGDEFESAAADFEMGAALFVGGHAAVAVGDYGAGPNHVLPTGGMARSHGALSVATFMRMQTRLTVDDPQSASQLTADARDMGRIEGLEAHARSAEFRLPGPQDC